MKTKEQKAAYSKARYAANREERLAQQKVYYEANRENVLAQHKARYLLTEKKSWRRIKLGRPPIGSK